MSYAIFNDDRNKVIYQRVTGIFTASELAESNHYIKTLPDSHRMLFDLTGMRLLDVSDKYLEQLGRRMRTELPVRYRSIIANERHFDHLQLFAAHASTAFRNVQVFASMKGACHWMLINDPDTYVRHSFGQENPQGSPISLAISA